jgi:hypothetical protein
MISHYSFEMLYFFVLAGLLSPREPIYSLATHYLVIIRKCNSITMHYAVVINWLLVVVDGWEDRYIFFQATKANDKASTVVYLLISSKLLLLHVILIILIIAPPICKRRGFHFPFAESCRNH